MPSRLRALTSSLALVPLAAVFLAAPLLVACGGSASDDAGEALPVGGYVEGEHYAVEWSFAAAPQVGEVEFLLFAERASSNESEQRDPSMAGVEVTVEAWMPGHAHGLPDTPPVEVLEPGRYEVSGLVLTMPGTWEIDVTVSEGDVAERLAFSIEVE